MATTFGDLIYMGRLLQYFLKMTEEETTRVLGGQVTRWVGASLIEKRTDGRKCPVCVEGETFRTCSEQEELEVQVKGKQL